MRVLQGAAIGGEMPGAWVFVAEHSPAKNYGLAIGSLTSGITGGIFLGSIFAVWLNSTYSQRRSTTGLGACPLSWAGVFGLVSVYLRKFLQETPLFQDMQKRKAADAELPIKTILREHQEACWLVALMTWVLSTAIVVVVCSRLRTCKKSFTLHRCSHEGQCRGHRDTDHRLRILGLAV